MIDRSRCNELGDGVAKSLAWLSANTPKNCQPTPDAWDMGNWENGVLPMSETGATNIPDGTLYAVAFEGGSRSGERYGLTVGDGSDYQYGNPIHVDGETAKRDVLIANDAIASTGRTTTWRGTTRMPGFGRVSIGPTEPEQSFLKYFSSPTARVGVTTPVSPTTLRTGTRRTRRRAG